VLGCVVSGRTRKNSLRSDGKIVDDSSAAFHQGQGRSRHKKHASKVGVDDLSPGLQRQFVDMQIGVRHARIVDQDIQVSASIFDRRTQVGYRFRVSNVTYQGHGFSAKLFRSFFQTCLMPAGNDEITSFGDQCLCDGKTDATTPAGNECNFSLEAQLSSSWFHSGEMVNTMYRSDAGE
jgi:hypothetical protein